MNKNCEFRDCNKKATERFKSGNICYCREHYNEVLRYFVINRRHRRGFMYV